MWTQAWRRLNKKGKDEGIVRKRCVVQMHILFVAQQWKSYVVRVRKIVKVQRAIVGVSLEDVSKLIFIIIATKFLSIIFHSLLIPTKVNEEEVGREAKGCPHWSGDQVSSITYQPISLYYNATLSIIHAGKLRRKPRQLRRQPLHWKELFLLVGLTFLRPKKLLLSMREADLSVKVIFNKAPMSHAMYCLSIEIWESRCIFSDFFNDQYVRTPAQPLLDHSVIRNNC